MNHNETDIGMREAKAGKCVSIGKLKLENPFVLAPLAGITDAPMRRICRQMGASLTYSEMVSAKGMYYGDRKTEKLLALYDDEGPTACQIFGSEPELCWISIWAVPCRRWCVTVTVPRC